MKVWFDFCEPKTVTMLRPLYNQIIKEHEVLLTARDFDATYPLLDAWNVPYYKVGTYGGRELKDKLHSYVDRLQELLTIVEKEKPDFLFSLSSPEGIRISYGLKIPTIIFNDEPRSVGVCALTVPFVNRVIVSATIPPEWYIKLGVEPKRLIRYNGIDEIAWLNRHEFKPNKDYLKSLNLEADKYIVLRSEATQAYAHLQQRMNTQQTLLIDVIPQIQRYLTEKKIDCKLLLISRYDEQHEYLKLFFKADIESGKLILKRNISNLAHILYYAKMVISGGGTMVREAALLGIPSIEFIPSETYPQEIFLIENNFPIVHVKQIAEIVEKTKYFFENNVKKETWEKIDKLDNPIKIALDLFNDREHLD